MPDQNGKLTPEEKQKFVAWLNAKTKSHQCPVCDTNGWTVADHLIDARPHTGGGLVVGGTTYPSAILVCNNCAYTRQFMAVPIGLLSSPDDERSNPDVGT